MNSKQAKEIPLEIFLSKLGHNPNKRNTKELWFLSPLHEEKTASFKVNLILNTWYDFSLGKGGNIIDLAMNLFQTSVKGALDKIEGSFSGGHAQTYRQRQNINQKKQISLPEEEIIVKEIKPLSYFPLIDYLVNERKINIEIAKKYLIEIHYEVKTKPFFSIGFKNDSKGYETRNKFFKGNLSEKDITTLLGGKKQEIIIIFEGFIDFLSFLTLQEKENLEETVIVLNSVWMVKKAIEKIKSLNPLDIFYYLNNDKPGEKAKKEIQEATGIQGIQDNFYFGFNDINEYLKFKRK